jgi:hypothetical protein
MVGSSVSPVEVDLVGLRRVAVADVMFAGRRLPDLEGLTGDSESCVSQMRVDYK